MERIIVWNDLFLWKQYQKIDENYLAELFFENQDKCTCDFVRFGLVKNWFTSRGAEHGIVVGTRPALLYPNGVLIKPERVKNEKGHTQTVMVDENSVRSLIKYIKTCSEAIIIYEDAIVEGYTMERMIQIIRKCSSQKVKIYVYFAVEQSVHYLEDNYHNVQIFAQMIIPGIPVQECTVLFLSDLLQKDPIQNMPFIENKRLMIPCFGSCYSVIRDGLYRALLPYVSRDKNVAYMDMENDKAGFFYLMKTLLNGYLKMPNDAVPYVHFGRNDWYPIAGEEDLFDLFFEQKTTYQFPHFIVRGIDCDENSQYGDYDQESQENFRRALQLRKNLHLKEDIHNRLKQEIFALLSGRRVLGCHIRHGFTFGFYGHPKGISLEKYFEAIRKCMTVGGYQYCFIATDNEVVIDRAREVFGEKLLFHPARRAPDTEQPIEFYLSRDQYDGYQSVYECLRDMMTLSYCNDLITGRSNLSYIALLYKLSRREHYFSISLLDEGICNGGISWHEYIANGWNKKSRECLFVCDLDGTIVQSGRMSTEEEKKWRSLLDSGITLTVATARSNQGMIKCLKGMIPALPTIHYNGALVFDQKIGKIIYTCEMEDDACRQLLRKITQRNSRGMCICMEDNKDRAFMVEEGGGGIILGHCLAVYEYTDQKPIQGPFIGYHYDTFNEYTSVNASKGTAVKWLADYLEFKKIYAIGDDENDMSMFAYADKYYLYRGNRDHMAKPMDILKEWWAVINEGM